MTGGRHRCRGEHARGRFWDGNCRGLLFHGRDGATSSSSRYRGVVIAAHDILGFIASSIASGIYAVILIQAISCYQQPVNLKIIYYRLTTVAPFGGGRSREVAVKKDDRRARLIPFAPMVAGRDRVSIVAWYGPSVGHRSASEIRPVLWGQGDIANLPGRGVGVGAGHFRRSRRQRLVKQITQATEKVSIVVAKTDLIRFVPITEAHGTPEVPRTWFLPAL